VNLLLFTDFELISFDRTVIGQVLIFFIHPALHNYYYVDWLMLP